MRKNLRIKRGKIRKVIANGWGAIFYRGNFICLQGDTHCG
jgi:hypothetical protein